MLSNTLVPVYHYIGRPYTSISSINHAHALYIAFDKCFYISDVVLVKSLYITV